MRKNHQTGARSPLPRFVLSKNGGLVILSNQAVKLSKQTCQLQKQWLFITSGSGQKGNASPTSNSEMLLSPWKFR